MEDIQAQDHVAVVVDFVLVVFKDGNTEPSKHKVRVCAYAGCYINV